MPETGLSGPARDALRASGHRIVITGAGGWIGLATLELLQQCLGPDFQRRVVAFGSADRILTLRDGTEVAQRPLAEVPELPAQASLVLHLAFLTKDKVAHMDEAEYVRANRALSQTVLDSLDAIGANAVFVASSGAARSAGDPAAAPAMRLYGSLKKVDEDAFAAWAEQGDRRAVIARIFNLAGPYINKHETYALASFILDAVEGRAIYVTSTREVIRGYVAIRELMSLVFVLLLDGPRGATRFDTGGEPMEMQEIAERVAALLGPVPVQRASQVSGPADRYVGDDASYRALLERHGVESIDFDTQVSETAGYLIEKKRKTACRKG